MNLHALVAPIIGAVNANVTVTLRQSTGFTVNDDRSRTPTYSETTVAAQIQHLQFSDIKQMEGMATQGLRRKAYFYGNVNGIVRGLQKGGDIVIFPDGSEWLLAFVFETYGHDLTGTNGWCSVCLTLQNPTSEG